MHNPPTALVSNTLDYGVFDIQDTTDFMENTLNTWDQLNFHFDCICTGFLVSEKQVELLKRLFVRHPEALKNCSIGFWAMKGICIRVWILPPSNCAEN